MRSRFFKGVPCAFALLIAAVPARAQQPATPYQRITGAWELAISEQDARARLERGIGHAVDGMPPIVDAIAAGQLRGRVMIPHRITILATPNEITIRIDERWYTTRPGVPVDSVAPGGGEPMRITHVFRGENLEQSFRTPGGSKFNTYVVESETTMRFDAVVSSPQLPHEVRFSLPFRRVR